MSNLMPIIFKEKRILTTKQLANVYECSDTQIQQNFNNHSAKFKEGVHYFLLKGDELRAFKRNIDIIEVAPNVNKLYLWTERGANRHCKILDTDKAWEQFDNLEETYFRVKVGQPQSSLDLLELQVKALKEVEQKVENVDKKFDELPLFTADAKALKKLVNRVVVPLLGGKKSNAYKPLSKKVFSDLYGQVHREFGVDCCDAIKRKDLEFAREFISDYRLPTALKNEIDILNNQSKLEV